MDGDPENFNPEAQLPAFLKRVFTNRSVLFIGCSPVLDRTTMIMKQLRDMQPHFAVMKWPEDKEERVLLKRRLFSIEGAGGVGKTILAIEAAKRFKKEFKDGVLNPIQVDEHTPVSFAVHLAAQLDVGIEEPVDEASACALVTRLLQHRQCLVILNNALDWNNIKYMLPMRTASTLLITTRNRDMYRHLRLKCKQLRVHEISLEKFTPKEALALFQAMLETVCEEVEEDIYLEIAGNLGYFTHCPAADDFVDGLYPPLPGKRAA